MLHYQQELTTRLLQEYDLVAIERFGRKLDAENHSERHMSGFLDLLEYKSDLHSTHVAEVDPAGTTTECSECGVGTSKPPWIPEHSCPASDHTEDRDLNAPKNILSRNRSQRAAGCSELPPVQTALFPFFLRSGCKSRTSYGLSDPV